MGVLYTYNYKGTYSMCHVSTQHLSYQAYGGMCAVHSRLVIKLSAPSLKFCLQARPEEQQ